MPNDEVHTAVFRYASLHWSVPVSQGYGRRTRFLVIDEQNEKLIGIFALGAVTVALVTSGCASKSPIQGGAPNSGAPSPASSVGISSAIALTASPTPTVKATG